MNCTRENCSKPAYNKHNLKYYCDYHLFTVTGKQTSKDKALSIHGKYRYKKTVYKQ